MEKRNFKVIIAGGSIAGMTLANMLEKHGIDFVLLEAYGQIAPNIGASLGLFPNGLRILDQLGCFEEINKLRIPPFGGQHVVDAEGKSMSALWGLAEHLERRSGYPSCFLDRQQLIQILYDKLKQKDKVMVNKRVERIDVNEENITVITKDGDSFTGDLVVGADGVHSKVRQQMWHVANQIQPGTFDEKEAASVPSYFKCIFGISKPGIMPDEMKAGHVLAPDCTVFILEGPGDRAYFFLNVLIPDGPKLGKDIPRYTKEDEAKLAEEHKDVPLVKGKVTFGDLYAARISSTLVPLESHVWKKWYYGRIMTIGDAAHKQDPVNGQGGNGAMESAAVLTNALVKMLDQHPDRQSMQQIEAALAEAQEARHERATLMKDASHSMQVFFWKIKKTPFGELLVRTILRLVDPVMKVQRIGGNGDGGLKLRGIPLPKRARAIPYTDELPSKPIKGRKASWLPALLATALLVLLSLLSTATSSPDTPAIATEEPTSEIADDGLLTNSTGDVPVLITKSMKLGPGIAGGQYLLGTFAPTLIVWFVESRRLGNRLSLISLMGLFGALSLKFGISRVAPFYYILSIFTGSNRMIGRRIPEEAVYAIIPTIVLGLALLNQTLPMLSNAVASTLHKDLSWVLVPACFLTLNKLIQGWIKSSWMGGSKAAKAPRGAEALSAYSITDVPPLRKTYAAAFAVSGVVHAALIGSYANGSGLDLFTAFSTPSVLRDVLFHSLVLTVYLIYTVWDMRRLGYITTLEAIKAAVAVVAGQLLVGPGAIYVGTWFWREGMYTRHYVAFEEVTAAKAGVKA
ncbi:FAD-dependent urate hydroxylase [Cytospora mali]|uniref:FAD-dependent urate hydroxylase n=1 Tax=Cytospora mali TaxID=578113 RepID=A0A194W584_CYTMA|nr:FAD-dependent urate hydroxylase [Valsa mali]